VGDNNRVPGTNNYIRAVNLFQDNLDAYEEPSLMQVEVLTLLVSQLTLACLSKRG
jgi:D-Tyr-tRNAtyr deacylase